MIQKNNLLSGSNQDNSEYHLSDEILNSYDLDSLPINLTAQRQHFKYGHKSRKTQVNWTVEEEINFLCHMITHKNIYIDQELRRTHKIFKKMSRSIKTRTPEQCRSHYQKLMIKHKSYDEIIQSLQSKVRGSRNLKGSDDCIRYSQIQIEKHQGYALGKSDQSTKLSRYDKNISSSKSLLDVLKQKQLMKHTGVVEEDIACQYDHNEWYIWRNGMDNTIHLKIRPQIFCNRFGLAEF